ncbi:hypothetical protein KCU_10326 [Pasteurella multocida subsp. multocida str. P52VAC]|nr:hypothetical protein KCU_10326 [Pasteurella multocida subsp. multocida str. P52VAC]
MILQKEHADKASKLTTILTTILSVYNISLTLINYANN